MLESMSDLLTTGEAARVLEVSESTIRLWDRNGRLTARRTAGGSASSTRRSCRRWRRRGRRQPTAVDTTTQTMQPPHEPPPSPWMNRAEAATYARMSVASISRAIRASRLRAYRIAGGRAVRLHRDDVDAWLRVNLSGAKRVLSRGG